MLVKAYRVSMYMCMYTVNYNYTTFTLQNIVQEDKSEISSIIKIVYLLVQKLSTLTRNTMPGCLVYKCLI